MLMKKNWNIYIKKCDEPVPIMSLSFSFIQLNEIKFAWSLLRDRLVVFIWPSITLIIFDNAFPSTYMTKKQNN